MFFLKICNHTIKFFHQKATLHKDGTKIKGSTLINDNKVYVLKYLYLRLEPALHVEKEKKNNELKPLQKFPKRSNKEVIGNKFKKTPVIKNTICSEIPNHW